MIVCGRWQRSLGFLEQDMELLDLLILDNSALA
jgi:hypothetical protein